MSLSDTQQNTEAESTDSQDAENSKSRTVEVLITNLLSTAETTGDSSLAEAVPATIASTTVINTIVTAADPMVEPVSDHSLNPNPALGIMFPLHSVDDKSYRDKAVTQKFPSKLIYNTPLRPTLSTSSSATSLSTHSTSTSSSSSNGTSPTVLENPGISLPPLQGILQRQPPETQPKYARMKLNGTSPVIIYSHSAPKTLLDQWKGERSDPKEHESDLVWTDSYDRSSSSSSGCSFPCAFFTSPSSNSLLLSLFFFTNVYFLQCNI